MRRLLVAAAILAAWMPCASAQMMQTIVGGQIIPGITYSGMLDVVAGASACYSLRACSGSAASSHAAAVKVWKASDSSLTDIHLLSTGNLDTAAAATLAGTDATATCTVSGTTFTCTGASSTPNVPDPISGAGISQPCTATAVGSFSGGAGTVTASNPLTGASCGTVGSGVTMTFQVTLRGQTLYDQSSNADTADTGGGGANGSSSPQLILKCLGTSKTLPCLQMPATGAGKVFTSFSAAWTGGATGTISTVAGRTGNFTTYARIVASGGGSNFGALYNNTANTVVLYQGALTLTATASDQAFHALQYIMNTTTSHVDVDGTAGTNGDAGSSALPTNTMVIGDTIGSASYLWTEAAIYPAIVFSSGQSTSMHTNQSAYWGTP